MDTLEELIAAMEANDTAAIQGMISRVEAARDHVTNLGAEAGNTANRLSLAEEQIRASTLLMEERRSAIEDADIAEVVTQFQKEQNALQAAMKTTATVMQTSLLDYIR